MIRRSAKVGDMGISKTTGKPIICTGVNYNATGSEDSTWISYKKYLLKTMMGMSPGSNQVHPLQYFVDVLNANQPIQQKGVIKIRYAYIPSPKDIPAYPETLKFKVFSLEQLETQLGNTTIKELITNNTSPITIKGRDMCTGRVDMNGNDIYVGDIIRWFLDCGNYIDETIHQTTHFAELDATRDCKVVGTIYDKDTI